MLYFLNSVTDFTSSILILIRVLRMGLLCLLAAVGAAFDSFSSRCLQCISGYGVTFKATLIGAG